MADARTPTLLLADEIAPGGLKPSNPTDSRSSSAIAAGGQNENEDKPFT
jgi:hypothetical protein